MMFTRSSRSVEHQYEILLRGATARDAASMELVGGIKRSAQADFDNDVIGSFLGPDEFRPVQATPVNWYDLSIASNWMHVQIDQHNAPPSGQPGAGIAGIDPRLLEWRVASEVLRPTLKQPVKQTFEALAVEQVPPPQAPPEGRYRRPLRPRDNVFLDLHRVAVEIPAHAQRTISPLLVDRAALDFNATIGDGSSTQNVAADEFFLDVSICIVQARRPWFSDALLGLPNWYVVGFAKGAFSSAPPEHLGNLSILPTACIFIRDVTIKSKWSDADLQVIESSANLGGFNLFGRSFDSNTNTLTIPGMQSFAWICQPMPLLPPSDPPPA